MALLFLGLCHELVTLKKTYFHPILKREPYSACQSVSPLTKGTICQIVATMSAF
jgi:hypothetical protein